MTFLVRLAALGARTDGPVILSILQAIGEAVLGLAMIFFVGRYLLRPLLRLVANTRSADLFMAATLLIAVGAGIVAIFAGLSMAMGAFMAGLLLAETEFRREIEAIIEPFKGLMLGAFFMLVGMGMDMAEVAAHPLTILERAGRRRHEPAGGRAAHLPQRIRSGPTPPRRPCLPETVIGNRGF